MKKNLAFLFTFIFIGFAVFAQEDKIPEAPNPPRLINNFSKALPNFLSSGEQQALENKLVAFNNETSNQITIVIVDDLAGLAPYEYASKLGNKWGVGQAKYKNGTVILIKPTDSDGNKREVFISPSAGLQGVITDAATSRIIKEELIPNFKQGNYYEGLDHATDILISLAKGEYDDPSLAKKEKGFPLPIIIVLLIIFLVIGIGRRGGGGGGYTIGRSGRYYGGGWLGGGFGGGGGGFSGGGGGGFGGFGGGGGFNGGGSGGSW